MLSLIRHLHDGGCSSALVLVLFNMLSFSVHWIVCYLISGVGCVICILLFYVCVFCLHNRFTFGQTDVEGRPVLSNQAPNEIFVVCRL